MTSQKHSSVSAHYRSLIQENVNLIYPKNIVLELFWNKLVYIDSQESVRMFNVKMDTALYDDEKITESNMEVRNKMDVAEELLSNKC